MKPGNRVIAIRNSTESEVFIYGHGVYEGDFEPPTGPMGLSWEEVDEMLGEEDKYRPINPRIKLDDGQIVWGMQCWWGDEEKTKKAIAGQKITIVPVEELKCE